MTQTIDTFEREAKLRGAQLPSQRSNWFLRRLVHLDQLSVLEILRNNGYRDAVDISNWTLSHWGKSNNEKTDLADKIAVFHRHHTGDYALPSDFEISPYSTRVSDQPKTVVHALTARAKRVLEKSAYELGITVI